MLLFRKTCRKPRAILGGDFFRGFGGFFAETGVGTRAAEFAAPAGPACSFVLPARPASSKKSIKSGLSAVGPCFASGDPNEFSYGKIACERQRHPERHLLQAFTLRRPRINPPQRMRLRPSRFWWAQSRPKMASRMPKPRRRTTARIPKIRPATNQLWTPAANRMPTPPRMFPSLPPNRRPRPTRPKSPTMRNRKFWQRRMKKRRMKAR